MPTQAPPRNVPRGSRPGGFLGQMGPARGFVGWFLRWFMVFVSWFSGFLLGFEWSFEKWRRPP